MLENNTYQNHSGFFYSTKFIIIKTEEGFCDFP